MERYPTLGGLVDPAAPAREPEPVSPRPRRAQDPILQATLDVIAEQGVVGISVDTVAARATVSKATIYRHWGSRAARLIHAAISSLQQPTVDPDTGSLRGDLTVLLQHLVVVLRRAQHRVCLPVVRRRGRA